MPVTRHLEQRAIEVSLCGMSSAHAIAGKTGFAQGQPFAARCAGCDVRLLPARSYQVQFTPACNVIGFAFDPQEGMHAFASDRLHHFRTRANTLAFTPPGCEVQSSSPQGGEYLTIAVSSERHDIEGAPQFTDVIEPAAIRAAETLRYMLLSGHISDHLAIETQIVLLESCVERRPGDRDRRWMLTPRGLRLVENYIADHLGEAITVQSMAGTIGLSGGHFTRALKATIGKSPHEYVVDRRIAAARSRLGDRATSLTEVAAATGFASQSHMTTAFRRRLGVTPAVLRDRLRREARSRPQPGIAAFAD